MVTRGLEGGGVELLAPELDILQIEAAAGGPTEESEPEASADAAFTESQVAMQAMTDNLIIVDGDLVSVDADTIQVQQ